jgi:CRISPR-associated endonuclease/helicase Cas3
MAHKNEVDFGIAAFENRRRDCSIEAETLAAPRAAAPVLMPAYLDLWSHTSPPPTADPDVGLFLHGIDHTSVGVSIVWRSDVTTADLAPDTADLKALMSLVPPRAEEMVEVPLWAARAWLRKHPDSAPACVSDTPERDRTEESDPGSGPLGRWAFRWAGADDPRTGNVSPARLQPGDVLVVPAEYGGCDELGWAPDSDTPVMDVADAAARPFRRRSHAVRIAPDVAPDPVWERLREILADDGLSGFSLVERLLETLPEDAAPNPDGQERRVRAVREPLEALLSARRRRISRHFPYAEPSGGTVLVAVHGLRDGSASEVATPRRPADGAPSTEDDALSRTGPCAVSVDDHTRHVEERVKRSVRTLALPHRIARDLELAAFLHDAGKADRRFQVLLTGADPWNMPGGTALAKSAQPSPTDAWALVGLPRGWRHEALSVRMARVHPRFAEAHDPALVLWLIATHHGFGRPFFNFADPLEGRAHQHGPAACLDVEQWSLATTPGPESLAFNVDGMDWPALYEGLRKRYGLWGLAHLEAILRLSDHRASESERVSESESAP